MFIFQRQSAKYAHHYIQILSSNKQYIVCRNQGLRKGTEGTLYLGPRVRCSLCTPGKARDRTIWLQGSRDRAIITLRFCKTAQHIQLALNENLFLRPCFSVKNPTGPKAMKTFLLFLVSPDKIPVKGPGSTTATAKGIYRNLEVKQISRLG